MGPLSIHARLVGTALMVGLSMSAAFGAERGDHRAHPQERAGSAGPASSGEALPFATADRLDRQRLLAEVLGRNPSATAAAAAWRAALARAPQEAGLEDPMLSYGIAPLTIASDVPFGQSIRLDQRFPWPGKLRLAGEVALAEAAASKEAWRDTQLRLSELASTLFDDWYVVHRALEINAQHSEVVRALKKTAEAQYVVGRASQQDALQADSELAHMEHEAVMLATRREIVRVRLNGLLHLSPQAALPPPPLRLPVSTAAPPTSQELQEAALRRRPDLAGKKAQRVGRDAAVTLARRRYFPDIGVMATYNSMWMQTSHQLMLGLSINLPIYVGKRRAAVLEAEASRARAEAELAGSVDQVRAEAEMARQRLLEALHIHQLFEDRLLPVARDQITAARAGFETGANSFLAVMEAERNMRTVELQTEMALADLARRRAELDRAVGTPVVITGEDGAR